MSYITLLNSIAELREDLSTSGMDKTTKRKLLQDEVSKLTLYPQFAAISQAEGEFTVTTTAKSWAKAYTESGGLLTTIGMFDDALEVTKLSNTLVSFAVKGEPVVEPVATHKAKPNSIKRRPRGLQAIAQAETEEYTALECTASIEPSQTVKVEPMTVTSHTTQDHTEEVEQEQTEQPSGKVYAYARVSDGNRQEASTQLNSIQAYADKANLVIHETVTEAVSGSKTNVEDRQLSQLLTKIQQGDHLVITEVSRLGRSRPMQIMGLLDELAHDRGITIHLTYSDAAIDSTTIEDPAIFFQIVGAGFVAQQEAKRRSERAAAAHARRKAEGKKSGRKQGAIVSSWLDGHEWLIDARLQHWNGNISTAASDLSNDIKRNGKDIPVTTLRSAISRWLKRREELKAMCLRNQIAQTTDCTIMVELLQAKQRKGELIK